MDTFDPAALIICRPNLQHPVQRLASRMLATLAWSLWLYLWMPLVTLAGWALGLSAFHDTMVVQGGLQDLATFLYRIGPITAMLCAALVLWAVYNVMRFRGRERRRHRLPASVTQIAGGAGLRPADLLVAQRARRLYALHDEAGRLVHLAECPSGDCEVPADPQGRQVA